MDIWDWLDPWWAWWAGFTDLFDWEAIAAMATLLAVGVALEQSSRSARVEAQHGMGVFTMLIGLLEPLPELLAFDAQRRIDPGDAQMVLSERLLERAEEGLARLQVQDTSTLGISDYLGAIPLALEEVRRGLPAVVDGISKGSELDVHLEYIQDAVEDFRHRRSLLRRGPLGTAVYEASSAVRRSIGRLGRR